MRFTKMHGLGNDYVYINGFAEKIGDVNDVARKISDRHFGVGGDGMILILPSEKADVRMRMFNNDGSEGEMCGNGVRCVAKYSYDHGLTKNNPIRVETGRGVLSIDLELGADGKVARARVDMDEPILELDRVPVVQGALGRQPYYTKVHDYEYNLAMEIDGRPIVGTFVSMGNPHLVVFVNNLQRIDLPAIGPKLEHYPAFPKRANVHFAEVINRGAIRMITWERGSGITLACGTGACAVGVAGALTGRTDRTVRITLPGGDLDIQWASNNHVLMTGPATEVFSGEWTQ
ncbi:MAG: diaminopimelate epimerase [Tepidisphaeraceae bacterium]